MHRFREWPLTAKIAGISISAIILFITGDIISGIIGNGAYVLFVLCWGQLTKSISTNSLAWIITLLAIGFGFYELRRHRISSHGLNTMDKILKLDNSLLRLLPNLIGANGQEEALQRLLIELLLDATRTFTGDVNRASIMLPNETGEYLKIWTHFQMPVESITRAQFYIGTDNNRKWERGVAGDAYITKKIIIAHRRNENGQYSIDKTNYIEFDDRRPFPPYCSFVCVPILGSTDNPSMQDSNACLGVVCFDSWNPFIFDSAAAQELLRVLGSRIASVLLIYRQNLGPHDQLP